MRGNEIDSLQAFEMWVWRRMEKKYWKDKMANEEKLERQGEKGRLLRRNKK